MKTAKAIIGAVGIIVTALTAALADNAIGATDAEALAIAAVEAGAILYALWRVPNARFVDIDRLTADTKRGVLDELDLFDPKDHR